MLDGGLKLAYQGQKTRAKPGANGLSTYRTDPRTASHWLRVMEAKTSKTGAQRPGNRLAQIDLVVVTIVRCCLLLSSGALALRVAISGNVDWYATAIIPGITAAEALRRRTGRRP